ncbi:hypothetical protein CPB86DRAFT_369738 [Serendipita vermifera]|nr:hypothetical protein CPB86DRAFT_369738 [Serendipita vermifera]
MRVYGTYRSIYHSIRQVWKKSGPGLRRSCKFPWARSTSQASKNFAHSSFDVSSRSLPFPVLLSEHPRKRTIWTRSEKPIQQQRRESRHPLHVPNLAIRCTHWGCEMKGSSVGLLTYPLPGWVDGYLKRSIFVAYFGAPRGSQALPCKVSKFSTLPSVALANFKNPIR